MDRRRRMDAEGGRALHREGRARKLAVVVAVQNVLVVACLLVTFYVYWHVMYPEQVSRDNVHIQFGAITSISGNATLKFIYTESVNMMSVLSENETIYVNCTGPYVLYIYVCYCSLSGVETSGKLQLELVESKAPVISFPLQTSNEVCRGLHETAYLREKDQAKVRLYAPEEFKIQNVTVGLSYLLGRQCVF